VKQPKPLPLVLLLGVTAIPLFFLLSHVSPEDLDIDWTSFQQTLIFAIGGAAISTTIGGTLGALFGTQEFPGRRWLFVAATVLIAAPPGFWWIGVIRLNAEIGSNTEMIVASLAAGLALSPVTLLLVFAALRQIPSNMYEAARLALPPAARVRSVLLPLLRSALTGGFVLTVILLLGESELPFLFGFRTLMTDTVTTFSQTFNVTLTLPLIIPLLLTILVLGVLSGRPLTRTLLAVSSGSHGVIRKPGPMMLSIFAAVPSVYALASLTGYALPILRASGDIHRPSIDFGTITASVMEPVASAWIALALTLACAYPARRARGMTYMVWIALLLFCVPAGIYAIGWIEVAQILGGLTLPPIVAHASRAIALCTLGFAVGYSRLPASLESAARLVRTSAVRRAIVFVLPVIAASLVASTSLAAALAYADRDVGSLLLAPGTSRLTLNLYLASANAPSAMIGILAFAVLAGAGITVLIAAAGPALLWRRRV
jgi:iron(III) transport system permease protein